MSSTPWTSAERCTSTRTETTTTRASCSATSQAVVFTWWCGSRSRRRTGRTSPRRPSAFPASRSKLSTRPPAAENTSGMLYGTQATPPGRWAAPEAYQQLSVCFKSCKKSVTHQRFDLGAHSVAWPQKHRMEGLHSLQVASHPQTQDRFYKVNAVVSFLVFF